MFAFPPSLSGAVNCDDHHGCRCNADKVHNGDDDDTVMMAMMMMLMVGNLQDVCACFAVMLLSGIRQPMQREGDDHQDIIRIVRTGMIMMIFPEQTKSGTHGRSWEDIQSLKRA